MDTKSAVFGDRQVYLVKSIVLKALESLLPVHASASSAAFGLRDGEPISPKGQCPIGDRTGVIAPKLGDPASVDIPAGAHPADRPSGAPSVGDFDRIQIEDTRNRCERVARTAVSRAELSQGCGDMPAPGLRQTRPMAGLDVPRQERISRALWHPGLKAFTRGSSPEPARALAQHR